MFTFQFLSDKIDQNTNFAELYQMAFYGITRENVLHIFRACDILGSNHWPFFAYLYLLAILICVIPLNVGYLVPAR